MSLLSHLTFKSEFSADDIRKDEFLLKIAVHHANRLWAPDWSKVVISGEADNVGDLHLSIWENGVVYADAEVKNCSVKGEFRIYAKSGSILDCIKYEPLGVIGDIVRRLHELEDDHPVAVELKLVEGDRLQIEAIPCL